MSGALWDICPVRNLRFSAYMEIMKNAPAVAMIRQSRFARGRSRSPAALVLLLFLSGVSRADEPLTEEIKDPAWCNCAAIVASETEDLEAQLIAATRQRQAECRESLGVDMAQQRKGQGARLDACRCSCLTEDAEPGTGPWGDKRKPARSGS